ncbi:hypothetical protein BJY04DRAFT_200521 [Aspergillus karnatakaensis]|uniref:uncharacterized protein n=1 Tax=Aspergillus karnatakaensis TaxID=1810916 RepID=UPI003CCE0E36
MHLSVSTLLPLALSLLAASPASASAAASNIPASARRIPDRTADPTNPALTWHVSGFDVGCSPGGCVYNFNIYGVASPNTPAFNTTCNGTSLEKDYVECKDPGVLSQLVPQQYPNWTIKAQHSWREGAWSEYYALGEKNVTSGTKVFTIPVTEVYGVA